MNIKEAEERTGLKAANIRYYEQEGLLHPERNRRNNYREYSQEDVEVLERIKMLRTLDVPLREIRKKDSAAHQEKIKRLAEKEELARKAAVQGIFLKTGRKGALTVPFSFGFAAKKYFRRLY